jgi:hypothetical protein
MKHPNLVSIKPAAAQDGAASWPKELTTLKPDFSCDGHAEHVMTATMLSICWSTFSAMNLTELAAASR